MREKKLFVVGLSYKTAPVEIREQIAVHATNLASYGSGLMKDSGLSEVVVLSTCNRFEVYAVSDTPLTSSGMLCRTLCPPGLDLTTYLYQRDGIDAVKHLFSVASGLESMAIGETEITGQVKQAYQSACVAGLTGSVTNRVFQKALHTGKEIRTRTQIGRRAISVGSAAVELAEKIFGAELHAQSIMIIGAGKMGEACVKHLAKKGNRAVLVSNRSFDRAERLAQEFGGRALHLHECVEAMADVDIVVSSTGCPETILCREDIEKVMKSRRNRKLVLIDIAMPRDIEPEVQSVDGVYLYNIDDLESLVRENVRFRELELDRCQAIITKHSEEVMARIAVRAGSCRQSQHENAGVEGYAVFPAQMAVA